MQINLKKELVDLAGEPIKDDKGEVTRLGQILGNGLVRNNGQSDDPARNYILGTQCYQMEDGEFNQSDFNFIKDQFKTANIPMLYKGQIMLELDSVDAKKLEEETEEAEKKK